MAKFEINISGDTFNNDVLFTGTIKDNVYVEKDDIEAYCRNAAENFASLAKKLSKKDFILHE